MQVGDQAEQLGGVAAGDGDGVLDHPDGQRDPAAGDLRQVGAVGQEVPGPAQRDAVPDPDQHVGAGGQHGLDPRHAGKVAIHHPQPPGGEQVPVVLQRLVQQHLLGLALVPGAAGAGRPGGHAEGGAGGGGGDPQLAQLRVRGRIIRGARRPERRPVRRGVRHPDQRPVDRADLQVAHRDGAVVPAAVLAVDAGQRHVPQPLQRRRAERLPPGAGHRRGRHPVRPLPGHQDQVAEQGLDAPPRNRRPGSASSAAVNRIASAGLIARRAAPFTLPSSATDRAIWSITPGIPHSSSSRCSATPSRA